jgi:AAA domain/MarR family
LYLALEDGKRRLQKRIDKLLPTFDGERPKSLIMATEWPRSDQGGLVEIERWITSAANPRLIIIDTLAQFRKPASGKGQVYAEDYAAIAELQKLASKHVVTIVVVHHDRKGDAEDPFDTVSGSLGLTGAADTIAILKRQSGAVTLYVRGRDVEEAEKALQFNKETCRWSILGEASDVRRSGERARVLAALDGLPEGLSPAELSAELGITGANARQTLHRMARDGEVKRGKYGRYLHPDVAVTPVTLSQRQKNGSKINMISGECDSVTGVTGVPVGRATSAFVDAYPARSQFGTGLTPDQRAVVERAIVRQQRADN